MEDEVDFDHKESGSDKHLSLTNHFLPELIEKFLDQFPKPQLIEKVVFVFLNDLSNVECDHQ